MFLLEIIEQILSGSPVYPSRQSQRVWWRVTWQIALIPHSPTQGSLHFLFMHVWLVGQSVFIMHSGLQFGGDPMKVDKQVHKGFCWVDTLQCAFGPHGDDLHGSLEGSSYGRSNKKDSQVHFFVIHFSI